MLLMVFELTKVELNRFFSADICLLHAPLSNPINLSLEQPRLTPHRLNSFLACRKADKKKSENENSNFSVCLPKPILQH